MGKKLSTKRPCPQTDEIGYFGLDLGTICYCRMFKIKVKYYMYMHVLKTLLVPIVGQYICTKLLLRSLRSIQIPFRMAVGLLH